MFASMICKFCSLVCFRLTYWVVYAFFNIIECFVDWILFWLPFYYAFKASLAGVNRLCCALCRPHSSKSDVFTSALPLSLQFGFLIYLFSPKTQGAKFLQVNMHQILDNFNGCNHCFHHHKDTTSDCILTLFFTVDRYQQLHFVHRTFSS